MTDTHKEEPKTGSSWDYSKYFKLPEINTEALMASHRRNLEAANKAGKQMLEGANTVAKRQADMFRGAVERTTRSAREIATANTVSEKIAKHAQASKASFDSGVANVRELATIVSKTGENVFDLVSKRVSEGYDEVKGFTRGRGSKGGDDAPAEGGETASTETASTETASTETATPKKDAA